MSWRDLIEVHPAADKFPMISKSEIKELADDIAENGLRVGLILWTPQKLEEVRPRKGLDKIYLLDGRNRLNAIEMAYRDNDQELRQEVIEGALCWEDTSLEAPAKLFYGDDDPFDIAVSANIRRRHLTAAQKREIIAELLRRHPERSDRTTAAVAGVSHTTVAAVRDDLEHGGQIGHHQERVGSDGVSQPASKPSGKVIDFPASDPPPRKTASASAAHASDKRVNAFIKAAMSLSADELVVARNWFGDYCAEHGGAVFDSTRAGR